MDKPGVELDELVARKVFRLPLGECPVVGMDHDCEGDPWETGLKCRGCELVVFCDTFEPHRRKVKYYSADISAAWEVVEKILAVPEKPVITIQNCFNETEWLVRLFWPILPRRDDTFGSTAPHAICLAALKAVGG